MTGAPHDDYLSVLCKGVAERSPAVWLLPHTDRLAIRASTQSEKNIGSDSLLTHPIQEWFHVALVFNNVTQQQQQQQGKYSISAYLNGRLDVHLQYAQDIVANNASLHLFNLGNVAAGRIAVFSAVFSNALLIT